MKKIIWLIIMLPAFLAGQKPVQSEITNVVVYQQGAKISNTASVNLVAGTNEIVIRGVSTTLDQNSIQAKITGSAILLSATSRVRTLEDENIPKRTKSLQDSLQIINQKIKWLQSEKTVYEGEQNLIVINQKLGSNEEKVTVSEIVQLAEFYRKKLLEIKKKIFGIEAEIVELEKEKQKINEMLNQLKYIEGKTVGEIVLSISANAAIRVNVSLSYLTWQAGWTPIYDIRAENADDPIKLIYKANIFQQTGLAWDDVDLTVSTGNPAVSNERPKMYPWQIDFYVPVAYELEYKMAKAAVSNAYQRAMPLAAEVKEEEMLMDEVPTIGYGVTTIQNKVSSAYAIEVPQTIPSDGQMHLVSLKEYELTSKFSYHAIPKLDPGTFLIAKIADYGNYNLLPGQANLFFEGMYIGQSQLNPVTTVDSMLLSLGRDDKITVKLTQLTDLTAKQNLGTNTKETKAFEISVRNNNSFAMELDLMDQIPIAKNKEIEVKLEESEGAIYDADYGSLLWKLNLKAGETKKVKFIYTVKYPKGRTIQGL